VNFLNKNLETNRTICDWPECFAHAQNFPGAFKVEKYRTALEVYSNCTLTAF